ncbi:MAG: PEGA domain-containing protein [Kofleriaceae bacterium]
MRACTTAITSALGLMVWLGPADAGPKRKVRVETKPDGASVYIESKENGAACEPTPCTIELPIGETPLIVELANHDTIFPTVAVPKKGKIKIDIGNFTLTPSIGTLVIDGPAGATITVDGEDKGKAPARLDVSAETHKVVVTKGGKTIFDQYVDVPSGSEADVDVLDIKGGSTSDVELPAEGGEGGGGGGGGEGDGTPTTDGSTITTTGPEKPRAPYISVSAAMSVGFRSFTYENNQTRDTLRDESESGQVLLGPLVELWPANLLGIHLLRGLSLMGRFQFRINEQPVTGGGIQNGLSTFWQSFEVSVRHKWIFADRYGVEAGAGWTREQYRFNGTAVDKLLVPDAQYEAIRIGARFSMLFDAGSLTLEPGIDLEGRLVRDGGALQTRFGPATSVNGLRGAAGIVARFGGLHVRAEAALQRYAWSFDPTTDRMATGGTDMITLLGLYAGYAY